MKFLYIPEDVVWEVSHEFYPVYQSIDNVYIGASWGDVTRVLENGVTLTIKPATWEQCREIMSLELEAKRNRYAAYRH